MASNYINRLQDEVKARRAEADAMNDTIDAFRLILASDKFSSDTTIQVRDVQRWLDSIQRNGVDAFFNPESEAD